MLTIGSLFSLGHSMVWQAMVSAAGSEQVALRQVLVLSADPGPHGALQAPYSLHSVHTASQDMSKKENALNFLSPNP